MISFQNDKKSQVGLVFDLFTKTTVWVLIFASLFMGLAQFLGQPIDCWSKEGLNETDKDIFNSYCWIHASGMIDYETHKNSCIKNQVCALKLSLKTSQNV